MDHGDVFEQQRPRLFALAYRMLGSVADAEDVVQESFLRWQQVAADTVASPGAYLSTVVTRLCIDHLRTARVQREQYIGPWLPEPLLTTDDGPDTTTELAESLSMAFLRLLEHLSPTERAVFLLHDVFSYDFAEIAPMVGKTPVNCRQIARRARQHLAADRPRFDVPRPERHRLLHRFLDACQHGDMDGLLALLAPDATLYSDGGGKVTAALKPIYGADKIARFFLGIARKAPPGVTFSFTEINGEPGVATFLNGALFNVITLHAEAHHIRELYIIMNPDKLQVLRKEGFGEERG